MEQRRPHSKSRRPVTTLLSQIAKIARHGSKAIQKPFRKRRLFRNNGNEGALCGQLPSSISAPTALTSFSKLRPTRLPRSNGLHSLFIKPPLLQECHPAPLQPSICACGYSFVKAQDAFHLRLQEPCLKNQLQQSLYERHVHPQRMPVVR